MKIDINELSEKYLAGASCYDIAPQYGCSATTIRKKLIKHGMPMRNRWEGRTMNLPETNLTEQQQQIIDGCLLGDGSVLRRNFNYTAYFTLSTIHNEFAKHLVDTLPFRKINIRERKRNKVIFHGKEYRCKAAYIVRSVADKSLNKIRQEWYPDGKKIVPRNLCLSPTTIKYWFYGDGSTSFIPYKNNKQAYVRISLCTNGFTMQECEMLVDKLKKLELGFSIYLSKAKPMLVALKTSTVFDFFDYMGSCEVSCFDYKWKLPSKTN